MYYKNFEQANKVWGAPKGLEDKVGGLPANVGMDPGLNMPVSVSAWHVSDEDLEKIKETKTVWLHIYGYGHPPVMVTAEPQFGVQTKVKIESSL